MDKTSLYALITKSIEARTPGVIHQAGGQAITLSFPDGFGFYGVLSYFDEEGKRMVSDLDVTRHKEVMWDEGVYNEWAERCKVARAAAPARQSAPPKKWRKSGVWGRKS